MVRRLSHVPTLDRLVRMKTKSLAFLLGAVLCGCGGGGKNPGDDMAAKLDFTMPQPADLTMSPADLTLNNDDLATGPELTINNTISWCTVTVTVGSESAHDVRRRFDGLLCCGGHDHHALGDAEADVLPGHLDRRDDDERRQRDLSDDERREPEHHRLLPNQRGWRWLLSAEAFQKRGALVGAGRIHGCGARLSRTAARSTFGSTSGARRRPFHETCASA